MLTDNLPNRAALAREFAERGFRKGAEIGVYMAQYSVVLCGLIPNLQLICVDPWTPSRNHQDPKKLERNYVETINKLANFDVTIMRMTSLEAAPKIAKASLDFVYIDALHDYENVKNDLNAWVPKVRTGGVVSGHDWGHPGVTKAVKEYMAQHDVTECYATQPAVEDWYPSWYWMKSA